MKVICVLVLLSAAIISADLQSDINDILSQLPQHQKQHELVHHSQKPIESSDWLENFFKISEVQDLVDFFERRGIDIRPIFTNLFNNSSKYQLTDEDARSGRDVLSRIKKIFSSPKIAELIKQKEETSEEFKDFLDALRDPEFKILFYRAFNPKASLKNMEQQQRGFFKKVWKKVLAHGISVSIPFAG